MARELADVLHYLLPGKGPGPAAVGDAPRPACATTLALAADPDDALRAAFAWNLCVELTRIGTRSALLTPPDAPFDGSAPGAGAGPVGSELVLADAPDLEQLAATARSLAADRAGTGTEPGAPAGDRLLMVRVPAGWALEGPGAGLPPGAGLLDWTLLFCSDDAEDQARAAKTAIAIQQASPEARVGLTVHGVDGVEAAEHCFRAVAERCERATDRPLLSYGVLLDDLQVYRTFVDGRAVGLRQPQSRAAAALADVARLLREDAGAGG